MAAHSMRIAKVDEGRLDRLHAIEDELGTCVVAYEPGPRPASLSAEQLQRLKAAEQELGLTLVAYRCE